jgi:hypothetical protein
VSARSAEVLNENVVAKLVRYTSAVTRREPFIATRIVLCFIINLASKMIALLVPFAYKRGFDLLAAAGPGMSPQAGRAAFIAFMLHGVAKLTSETARELRTGGPAPRPADHDHVPRPPPQPGDRIPRGIEDGRIDARARPRNPEHNDNCALHPVLRRPKLV